MLLVCTSCRGMVGRSHRTHDGGIDELAHDPWPLVSGREELSIAVAPDQAVSAILRRSGRVSSAVLVLATLWPNHWATLTTRTDPDRHAQARELLDGHDIRVPDAFSETELKALAEHSAEDPRLREAVRYAADGQVTQYLAGVPVLMHRYTHAPPITKALIHAAMDARRLGAGPHLPLALLADAAPGYLTDTEWEQTGEDWLERALEYVTTPCNGIPGILVPIKTGTPRNRRTRRRPDSRPRGRRRSRARTRSGARRCRPRIRCCRRSRARRSRCSCCRSCRRPGSRAGSSCSSRRPPR